MGATVYADGFWEFYTMRHSPCLFALRGAKPLARVDYLKGYSTVKAAWFRSLHDMTRQLVEQYNWLFRYSLNTFPHFLQLFIPELIEPIERLSNIKEMEESDKDPIELHGCPFFMITGRTSDDAIRAYRRASF